MMTTPRVWSVAVMLAVFATGWTARLRPVDGPAPDPGGSPRLVNTCLITNDVKRLVEFYESILALEAKKTRRLGEITQSLLRAWECWQFSPRTLKKSTFPARPKRRRTRAWCCNSASPM